MARKRSRVETIHVMLQLARNGIRKTHMMYRANLSHRQLTKYLDLLIESQLLTQQHSLYITTARGQAFISTFHEIQAILGENPTSPQPELDAQFS